jgi:hypothetical protein
MVLADRGDERILGAPARSAPDVLNAELLVELSFSALRNSQGCVCSVVERSTARLTKLSRLSARKQTRRPLSVWDMGSDDARRVVQKALLVEEGYRVDRRKNFHRCGLSSKATPPDPRAYAAMSDWSTMGPRVGPLIGNGSRIVLIVTLVKNWHAAARGNNARRTCSRDHGESHGQTRLAHEKKKDEGASTWAANGAVGFRPSTARGPACV